MCRKRRDESFRSARLYHDGELYIIDVSQSVENEHPQALDFLKRDCVNVASWDPDKLCELCCINPTAWWLRSTTSLESAWPPGLFQSSDCSNMPSPELVFPSLDVQNFLVKQLEMSLAACCKVVTRELPRLGLLKFASSFTQIDSPSKWLVMPLKLLCWSFRRRSDVNSTCDELYHSCWVVQQLLFFCQAIPSGFWPKCIHWMVVSRPYFSTAFVMRQDLDQQA